MTQDLQQQLGPLYITGPVYLGESLRQTGQLSFFNTSSAKITSFQAGNATADATYVWPPAAPAGNNYLMGSSTAGVLSWINAPGVYAPIGSAFVTIGADATLTSERALTGTANQIVVTDNGAGSTVVLSMPQNIDTAASVTFANVTASGQFLSPAGTVGAPGFSFSGAGFGDNGFYLTGANTVEKLNISVRGTNCGVIYTTFIEIPQSSGLALTTVGSRFYIAEGTNATMGTSVLVGGTVTVSTTAVAANSRIMLTGQNSSGTHGLLTVSARVAGTSFTITSSSGTDTRTVAWILFDPTP